MEDSTNFDANADDAENFQADTVELLQQQKAKEPPEYMTLLNPLLQWYFFFAGQWFAPVTHIIESTGLPRKRFRIAYLIWQGTVVIIMWSFFAYSMGLFSSLRTLEEVDWLCPLTDIKNLTRGLSWIVNQHTGLVFFLMNNLERLLKDLKHLGITKDDVKGRASSGWLFFAGSVTCLFILPLGMHVTQMMMPDFMSVPRYDRNGSQLNETFPPAQIVLDAAFYTMNRAFALPVFYVFLNMLQFLSCGVEKFKKELEDRHYPSEALARNKAIQIKKLIRDTEKAFRFFLVLYIAMLLLASALEIFSVVEKFETVITSNHTVIHFLPASATSIVNLQTLALTPGNIKAFPHPLAGKHSFPYLMVVILTGTNSSGGPDSTNGFPHRIPYGKVVIDQFKLKTQEIVVTALLDITQNVVLYALPLYQMTILKSCLKSVLETVEDSDYRDNVANGRIIFNTRQDKEDFKNYFRDTCTSGIRVLGKEVSFLWTLVLTFFGPFVVVIANLMFKHIHVEIPWD